MSVAQVDFDQLRELEESLWRPETRFDRGLMESTFAFDFYEVGRSGYIRTRAYCLDQPSQPIDIVIPLPDFAVRLISDDVALVTYTSIVTYDDEVEMGHRSSIWSKDEDRWILRFHQGTAVAQGS